MLIQMHEFAIAKNIVTIAEEYARGEGKSRITGVNLEIGAFAGVMLETLHYAMDSCAIDTMLEGAEIHIDSIEGTGQCRDCGQIFSLEGPVSPCPACGSFRFDIRTGRELRIRSLIVEP